MNRRLSNVKCFEFPAEVLREYFGDSLLIFLFYPSDHLQNLILVFIINFPFFFYIFFVFFLSVNFDFLSLHLLFVLLQFFLVRFIILRPQAGNKKQMESNQIRSLSLWIKVVVTSNVHQRIFCH